MPPPAVSAENLPLLDLIRERDRLLTVDPVKLHPTLLPPCRVKVLLVTDAGLDFSLGGFGLRTFVETLLTMPGYYVKFDITLAHIEDASGPAMMDPDPRIVRRVPQFKFDDPAHFGPALYDQVWLFGIDTVFTGRGQGYPTDRLSDAELAALTTFMNAGGGLFATGDHGSLGVCLGGSVPRARSMRRWGPAGDDPSSEVSMTHARRNDTNRPGPSGGTQFNDQSDDVPQAIEPTLYHRRVGLFRYSFPHPLLCSPTGMIRVMPDHPHEGECVVPADLDAKITVVSPPADEYPPAVGGGPRPIPEVISTNSVLAGTTANLVDAGGVETPYKDPTQAHSFGGICAYDGHRAGVGRVTTDATWHHFININLIGDAGAPAGDPKRTGYLASPAGEAHLEQIKTYHRNLAVWLARPGQIVCMRRRLKWGLLWTDRVLEAVMTRGDVPLARLDARHLLDVGRHARDVLGRAVGACQARKLVLPEIGPFIPKPWLDLFDPWAPLPPNGPVPQPDPVPWLDPEPLLDIALGGALVALREAFPKPDPRRMAKPDGELEEAMDKAAARGVRVAVGFAAASFESSLARYAPFLTAMKGMTADGKAAPDAADGGKP